jgi:hypothetical protein
MPSTSKQTTSNDPWIEEVSKKMDEFASKHASAYSRPDRELSAIFEIGCFLSLLDDYARQGFDMQYENLMKDGTYRYLTSPNGNPNNFSYLVLVRDGTSFILRQQIRIRSHLHPDITFTPDIVVFEHGAKIEQKRDSDYAGGKRGMFALASDKVIAIHECKSLPGYPELYVSFVGMLVTAIPKLPAVQGQRSSGGGHLASTLFVGGELSALHMRMIQGLQSTYLMNILTGLHKGGWVLAKRKKPVNRIPTASLANKALKLTAAGASAA